MVQGNYCTSLPVLFFRRSSCSYFTSKGGAPDDGGAGAAERQPSAREREAEPGDPDAEAQPGQSSERVTDTEQCPVLRRRQLLFCSCLAWKRQTQRVL